MNSIASLVESLDLLGSDETVIDRLRSEGSADDQLSGEPDLHLYRGSLRRIGNVVVAMARMPVERAAEHAVSGPAGAGKPGELCRRLVLVSREPIHLGFDGPAGTAGSLHWQQVIPGPVNLGPLFALFPWTRPTSLRDRRTTIGMGDRTGLATAGQIAAARRFDVAPVLAQQSIRELDFTGRSFSDVVADAAFLVFQEGFTRGYGADGDHLKTIPDIDRALACGMPMITLDLTGVMNPLGANWTDAEIETAFGRLPADFRSRIEERYYDASVQLETATLQIDAATARRCAVMYGEALGFTAEVDQHLRRNRGSAYDLEISVDETTTPTLPLHHYFIARELEARGVAVNSLAPRFIGDFQKGIDYIGDIDEFARQFRVHAEIARAAGGYKVSVHSGSDKFSVYPVVGAETDLRLHLKTSGTSWLESLRTVAQCEPHLYRMIHRHAYEAFPVALKAYHITADIDAIAPLDTTADDQLPSYLDDPNCRQFLHISYGGLLRAPEIRGSFFAALHRHEMAYRSNVERHMTAHLERLGVPATDNANEWADSAEGGSV